MKKIIFIVLTLFLMNSTLVACEGDCVLCHPKLTELKDDLAKEHEVLVTCKTCHTQEEMEKIDMGNGCGDDCWDCHDINKVVKSNVVQHQGLQKCIDCHVAINKNMWGGEEVGGLSSIATLDDIISTSESVTEKNTTSINEELNKSIKELNESVDRTSGEDELTIWNQISTFFQALWQKIVNIFS